MRKFSKLLVRVALSVFWVAVPLLWMWGVYEVWWALQAVYDRQGVTVNDFVMLMSALGGLGVLFIACLLWTVKLSIRCCMSMCHAVCMPRL